MASSSDDEVRYQALKESIDNIRDDIARLYSIINTSTDNCTSVDETAGEEINSGDTSWMMVATTLVLLMTTPGIMLYYSGLVRLQNVLSTAMQGYSIACLVTFLWLCFGYSLAFAPSNSTGSNPTPLFGDATRFWLNEMTGYSTHEVAPTIPESVFCAYHLAFAIITPSLICGAFADRMRYIPMLICIGLWHLIVYCPLAHATWHPDGFLKKQGVLDFAGGCVVHVSAGFSALVSAVIIGQRTGLGKFQFHPHNMLISITGIPILVSLR